MQSKTRRSKGFFQNEKLRPALVILLAFVILVSCQRTSEPTITEKETCLAPMFTSSFVFGESGKPYAEKINQDPETWQKVSLHSPFFDKHRLDIQFVEHTSKGSKVWLVQREINQVDRIWTYQAWDQTWHEMSSPAIAIRLITQLNDGSIWLIPHDTNSKAQSVYVFDTSASRFINDQVLINTISGLRLLDLVGLHDRKVWLTTSDENRQSKILLYDLESSVIEASFDIQELKSNVILDKDGNAYFLNDTFLENINFSNQQVERILFIETEYQRWVERRAIKLLLDQSDRLWVNDQFWIDISNLNTFSYHIVFRSPIFVHDKSKGRTMYAWDNPAPQASTADGRVWFKGVRGLAWFQPETGEWCMFTTAQSNIVKDSEGNLWLIYDNALYMLPAEETKGQSKSK